jgi:hypothetical protein
MIFSKLRGPSLRGASPSVYASSTRGNRLIAVRNFIASLLCWRPHRGSDTGDRRHQAAQGTAGTQRYRLSLARLRGRLPGLPARFLGKPRKHGSTQTNKFNEGLLDMLKR